MVAAHQQTSGWLTCRAKALNVTTAEDAPADTMEAEAEVDGCFGDWIPTNAFSAGEYYIDRYDNAAACVAQAKIDSRCEGFNLVNVEKAGALDATVTTGCWCQKSNGSTVSS